MSNSLARTTRGGAAGGTAPTRQQLDELDALLQRMLDLPVNHADEEVLEPPAPVRPSLPPRVPETEPPTPPRSSRFPSEGRWLAPPPQLPSYVTVETASPVYQEASAPPPGLGPRVLSQPPADDGFEDPVPGGRHDLEEDTPLDPTEELARLKARLAPPSFPPPAGAEQESGEWVPLRSSWQPSAQTWKPLAERWEQTRGSSPGPLVPIEEPFPGVTRMAPASSLPPPPAPPGPLVTTQTAPEPPPAPPPAPVFAGPPASLPRPPWPLLPLVWFNAAFDLLLLPWGAPGRWLRSASGRDLLAVLGLLCLLAAVALGVADGLGWTW